VNGAAARLGLKRTTLIARMKKLGIDGCKRRSTAIGTHRYSIVCSSVANDLRNRTQCGPAEKQEA